MFPRLISYLSIALCSFYLTACSGPETAQDVSVAFVKSAYSADVKKTLDCIDFYSADKEDIEDLESKKLVEGKLSQVLPEKQKEIEKEAGGIKKIQAVEAVFNKDMTQAEIKVEVVFNGRLKGKTSTIEPVHLVKTKQGWKVQIK